MTSTESTDDATDRGPDLTPEPARAPEPTPASGAARTGEPDLTREVQLTPEPAPAPEPGPAADPAPVAEPIVQPGPEPSQPPSAAAGSPAERSQPSERSEPSEPSTPVWPSLAYWVRATLAVVATLAVIAAARRVSHTLLLVVIAFVLAVGMDPAVRWLGRYRVRRGWAVTLLFTVLALFLALFVILLVPPMVGQIQQFAEALPSYLATLQERNDWIGRLALRADVSARVQDFVADIPNRIGQSFNTIIGFAGTVVGRIFDLFTISILSIYFMLSLPQLRHTVASFTRPAHRARVDLVLERSIQKIGGYVSGNLITSSVCGVLAVIALLGIRVPYAVPLGLWAGVADLIPMVGSYLGAVPAVFVAIAKGPVYGIITVAYFIAYQQFENYILAPRVYRNSIDLSPAAVIVSTLIGGTLAGFAGALLALPVAATIKVITFDILLASRLDQPPPAAPNPAGEA